MDKNDVVYIAEKLNCSYEAGISIEIDFFIKDHAELISSSDVSFYDLNNCYELKLVLTEFSLPNARETFHMLLNFISYGNAFYIREMYDNRIEYYLVSTTNNKKGFYLHLTFIGNSEKAYDK